MSWDMDRGHGFYTSPALERPGGSLLAAAGGATASQTHKAWMAYSVPASVSEKLPCFAAG